jgi:hypothetical protein
MLKVVYLTAFCMACSGTALAAPNSNEVAYAPPESWVLPAPEPTEGAAPSDAPLRFVYSDQQVRTGSFGQQSYIAYRAKILKPEGLQIGNVTIVWNPSAGTATVHKLRIIRDGQEIDILKNQRFQIIQREGGLEQAMLNGQLTAMLQVPGLRIGDELEFAITIAAQDPTLGDHVFGAGQLPVQGMPGAFRFRLNWPDSMPLNWRATRDLPQNLPAASQGQSSIQFEMRDPNGSIINDGAPARYNIRRFVEYSNFAKWSDVSKRFAPLFDQAAMLSAESPLREEAAKIKAASSNPTDRAQAALRLVQEQVRYVYVGLDGGNYRPMSADEAWERRFGDCKGKTAILLALLRELKIEAEPLLVSLIGDDGVDVRLPSPTAFNHVLIRAKIGKTSYLLDGTRSGDQYLDLIPPPHFRWALPVRAAGSDLEAIAPIAPALPQLIDVVDIDARAGFAKPAKVQATHIVRQDEAYATRAALVGLSTEDADRALRSFWRRQMDWVEPDSVSWRYDDRRATLVLSLTGEGKPDWEGDDQEGRSLSIPGAGFYAPDMRRRSKEQDQAVPWATEFPRFRCYVTSIALPDAGKDWRWTYYADPMDRRLGEAVYWRASGMQDGIMRTVMSRKIDKSEITAVQAREVNDAIPNFNNKMSRVYQIAASGDSKGPAGTLPFEDQVDWSTNASACNAPSAR